MFQTNIKLDGDVARRVDHEARRRDLSPDEIVRELVTLAFAARSFARRASRQAESEGP